MAPRTDPSALRWLIGAELGRYRRESPMALTELAASTGIGKPELGHMETGRYQQFPEDIANILRACGADQPAIDRLTPLAPARPPLAPRSPLRPPRTGRSWKQTALPGAEIFQDLPDLRSGGTRCHGVGGGSGLVWHMVVGANYRMFGFHDPTCEESENLATAISAASREVVGWAANAVMVHVVTDLVGIDVRIEVFHEAPAPDDSADLLRDGQIEVPGGLISVLYSVDDKFQRGVDLPAGPGSTGCGCAATAALGHGSYGRKARSRAGGRRRRRRRVPATRL
ncbi:helix-turn-helix domain-containing protein [Micromonospora rubida]|uniref:helix-turn-helix domain-containing protein n=1 Tax=Micromonospora rubida TaxID=2697657 RepID=UPI0013766A42|nr:helix-turn-helix transcriptional regulator [Micromonospora rubida]NBE83843.1 helix-turn-helix domain-containing protein [Micromonospora rubida]